MCEFVRADDVKGIPKMVFSHEDFSEVGQIVKMFMLYDVVFVFKDGILYHYKGIFGGWILHGTIEKQNIEESNAFIKDWTKGNVNNENYKMIVRY